MRVETIGDATLYLGDCREILPTLGRVDAVVTDPPYGVTDYAWDIAIAPQVWMVAPCISFAAEPFATDLISAAPLAFKYDLVWAKNTATNLENCKIRPARSHERILIFGNLPYTAQKTKRTKSEISRLNFKQRVTMEWKNPGSVLQFDAVNNRSGERNSHPSQKPTALMEWLLRSYTRAQEIIIDPFMGSGTTGVACVKLGRRFIGIEREEKYFDVARKRIESLTEQEALFA
jgi:DNA modification methylase